MLRLRSVLRFIFLLHSCSFPCSRAIFTSKTPETLEDYVIDLLFSNSLTIIRCNPYERQILRGVSMNTIGHVKCSNQHLFLPSNHIEEISLLQWNETKVKCNKKQQVIEERTYIHIQHKPTKAFKKQALKIIRVGSMGSSEIHWKEKERLLYIEHPLQSSPSVTGEIQTDVFSFKHRPILCRERQLAPTNRCDPGYRPHNLSYVCYYRIGVVEPPTIADMEDELDRLPKNLTIDDDNGLELYTNRRPKRKKSSMLVIVGILGAIAVICVIVGTVIHFKFCQSSNDPQLKQAGSDTSLASNVS